MSKAIEADQTADQRRYKQPGNNSRECHVLRPSALLGASQGRQQALDWHAAAVVGVNKSRPSIRADHERCWDRQHPRLVALVARKSQTKVSEKCLHLIAEIERQIER
jgi:hypothetical protein